MGRGTRWRLGGVLIAGLMVVGCVILAQREPMQVNLVGLEPLPGEGMEIRMAVKLRVQNPNDVALDFDGISLTLDVRGSTFATGVSAEHGNVPRFGETVVTVPVTVSALSVVRQVMSLSASEHPRLDYALHGRLSGADLGAMRFESHGEIDLPRGILQE
jgi:LEA14-like dessication related protein